MCAPSEWRENFSIAANVLRKKEESFPAIRRGAHIYGGECAMVVTFQECNHIISQRAIMSTL